MLSPEDRERVRAAVAAAEKDLAAEIVPCVFAQSSPYPETVWAGAAAGAALACAGLFAADLLRPPWEPLTALILWVPAAGLVGAALGRWCAPVKRFLLGPHRMEEAVSRRAKEVFFDRGVAATKARDGVLIYAGVLERRVVVLSDTGVRAKVRAEAWAPVVRTLTAAAGDGRVADALVAAVAEAAKVLREAGFSGRSDDELGDAPVDEDGR